MSAHDMARAGLGLRRCRAKLPQGEHPNYWGRCDLNRGHEGAHMLERGMEEVHFTFDAKTVLVGSWERKR